jgi:hypothetical protein
MFPLEKHKTAMKREFLRMNCYSSILTIFRTFAEIFFRMKITDIFLAAVLILCMTACTENQPEKNTYCCGFRERASRCGDGETRSEMHAQPHQQPVHRQEMPLLTREGNKQIKN